MQNEIYSGNLIVKETNPEQYIYLVANSDGHYDEYMFIEGTPEKVGDWTIDLSDYATKTDVENSLSPLNALVSSHDTSIAAIENSLSNISSTILNQTSSISTIENSLSNLSSTVSNHVT